jgi:hypothetical protein
LSRRDEARDALDPANRNYWRKDVARLDAETLRDRMLAASGQLDLTLFGAPVAVQEDDAGQTIVDSKITRRSVYVQQRRTRPVALLQAFDAPVMQTNCESRPSSTVATQSLMLLNGQFSLDQAAHLARRVLNEPASELPTELAAEAPAEQRESRGRIVRAWQLAYLRMPSQDELQLAAEYLSRQADDLKTQHTDAANQPPPEEQAFANLCHVLLNSNEFLYVD